MADTQTQTKLLFPQLRPFYDWASPWAWTIIRVACGFNLMIHGWPKFFRGPEFMHKAFIAMGFDSILWVWGGLFIEFIGGIALMLGLFTRFFAAAAAIEMLIITLVYIPNGFSWLGRGYEYSLFWGWVCFAIALRGAGLYSVDRKIGTEL